MRWPGKLGSDRRVRYPALVLLGGVILGLHPTLFLGSSPADDPYRLGLESFERRKPDEALQYFLEAQRLRPKDARVANALGNTWFALNQLAKAQQQYTLAIRLDPQLSAARKNLGILEYQEGHYHEAARLLAGVVSEAARDAVAWRFLGLSLAGSQQLGKALVPLRKSLELDPDNASARLDLAQVEAKSGATQGAVADYRQLIRNPALDAESQRSVGLGLTAIGDNQDAISQIRYVLEHNPEDEELTCALARAYLQIKQPEQAIATLQSSLSAAKHKAGLFTLLGWAYQKANRANEAGEAYREAIQADPRGAEPYLQLSWLYAEFHHFDEAAKTLREGLRFVSDPDSLNLQLGTILVLGGHEQEAVPVLKSFIGAQPHNPAGYTTLIINYTLLAPSYDRPLQIAEKALQECPGDYLIHYLYAGLLFRANRQNLGQPGSEALDEQIRSELIKSVGLNPGFPHSHYDLARLEFETNHPSAAEREALAALRADPDFSDARYLLGRIYMKEGRKQEGAALISQVEEQHINEIDHVESVAQALLTSQAAASAARLPAPDGSQAAASGDTPK